MNIEPINSNFKNMLKRVWQGFKKTPSFASKNALKFNLKSLLKQAWQDYKQRPFFYSLVSLLIIALGWVNQVYTDATVYSTNPWVALLGLAIVMFFVQTIAGIFRLILKAVNGEKPKFQDLLIGFRHIMRFLGVLMALFLLGTFASIIVENYIVATWAQSHLALYNLYVLLVLGGLIYMLLSLQFVLFSIVNPGFIMSFKQSWLVASGYRLKLLWLWLVVIVFNSVGVALLGVGVLVTLPLSLLVFARVYQQLQLANKVKIPKNRTDILV